VLALEKTLTRFTGVHRESGLPVFGYEIHHGVTESGKLRPLLNNERGGIDGAISDDGKVWGAYVHGIFDADEFRRTFIDGLRVRRGLKPLGAILNQFNMEPALDRLAETVRVSLNMPKIYQLLGV
jgi:cobyric acid synthase